MLRHHLESSVNRFACPPPFTVAEIDLRTLRNHAYPKHGRAHHPQNYEFSENFERCFGRDVWHSLADRHPDTHLASQLLETFQQLTLAGLQRKNWISYQQSVPSEPGLLESVLEVIAPSGLVLLFKLGQAAYQLRTTFFAYDGFRPSEAAARRLRLFPFPQDRQPHPYADRMRSDGRRQIDFRFGWMSE